VMRLNVRASLKHQEVLLRKKRLKKDYLEKRQIQNQASVDQIVTKNLLAIENLWVKKNHSGIENLLIEKRVIVSPLLNVNPLQEHLLKNLHRLERLEHRIQNQMHQSVKHAFRKIY